MHEKSNEQTLIDIAFQLVLTYRSYQDTAFKGKSREEVAKWVAEQLEACGFPTTPCGASWGVLKRT